jgi:hypothetical protein
MHLANLKLQKTEIDARFEVLIVAMTKIEVFLDINKV